MNKWVVGVLLLGAAVTAPSHAMTVFDETVTCPVGGEVFETESVGSGTAFGQNLDRRQVGAIASPWPIAKCPGNGFVLFKEDFEPGELQILTTFVATPGYQAAQARESNHYLAALLQRELGAAPLTVASALLQSTWEVEGDDRYDRYAAETLAEIERLLASADDALPAEDRLGWEQLAGEMERRLGRFDAAAQRFQALLPRVLGSDLEALVRQELALVDARDRESHRAEPSQP